MASKAKIIGGLVGAAALSATALIIPFEGKRLVAYLDEPKIPSICYGHTTGVQLGDTASDQDCVAFLIEDIKPVDEALTRLIKAKITEKYKAALISFTYNVGIGNFSKSTLLKKLNLGQHAQACDQLLNWVCVSTDKGKGDSEGHCMTSDKRMKISTGLVRRRQAENALCMEGIE